VEGNPANRATAFGRASCRRPGRCVPMLDRDACRAGEGHGPSGFRRIPFIGSADWCPSSDGNGPQHQRPPLCPGEV